MCCCLFISDFSRGPFLPRAEHKHMHPLQISMTESGMKQRGRKRGYKTSLSRLLLSKECTPWSWCGLRWHKWGKRGGHSYGLITLMETLLFCQGLQKTFGDASVSCFVNSRTELERKEPERDRAQASAFCCWVSHWMRRLLVFRSLLGSRLGSGISCQRL